MMEIELINEELLSVLHQKAEKCERKRMNYDLRTTPKDTSQRMLNALEPGTKLEIHRHVDTTETVVCLEGCFDEIFYEELTTTDGGEPIHNGKTSIAEAQFVEVARYRICPREGKYGIQIPKMAWHSIEVYEPSCIFEAKDGAYAPCVVK